MQLITVIAHILKLCSALLLKYNFCTCAECKSNNYEIFRRAYQSCSQKMDSKVLTEYMEFLYSIETLGSAYSSCRKSDCSAHQGKTRIRVQSHPQKEGEVDAT